MSASNQQSKLRIGTRSSRLALCQAHWVRDELERRGVPVEIIPITTTGDVRQKGSIANLGAVGVFTKEIQRELLRGEIDLAVHSLKDLPTDPVPGLTLGAVPVREDHRDVFISNRYQSLREMLESATVGTGSLRRRTQILHLLRQKINVADIRGNIETRLRKLDDGEYDAIILAAAGLNRLEYHARIRDWLAPPAFLPAPGQGALGLEIRTGDDATLQTISLLDDQASHLSVLAERAFLQTLEGGCIAPIGTYATLDGNELSLHGRVLSPDGTLMYEKRNTTILPVSSAFPKEAAIELGRRTAEELLDAGADTILDLIKGSRQ